MACAAAVALKPPLIAVNKAQYAHTHLQQVDGCCQGVNRASDPPERFLRVVRQDGWTMSAMLLQAQREDSKRIVRGATTCCKFAMLDKTYETESLGDKRANDAVQKGSEHCKHQKVGDLNMDIWDQAQSPNNNADDVRDVQRAHKSKLFHTDINHWNEDHSHRQNE